MLGLHSFQVWKIDRKLIIGCHRDWKGLAVLWLFSIFSERSYLLPLLVGLAVRQLVNVLCCHPVPKLLSTRRKGA